MPYRNHFSHADDIITHLDTVVPAISDPLLQAKYVGFVSVAAVTVYEMAIKDIFIEFAQKKHRVFGHFTESFFHRINGRIKIKVIREDYICKFGSRYDRRFAKKLDKKSRHHLSTYRRDIASSYSNIITWRNNFAHEGSINGTTTYREATQAYRDGKEVIHCLAETMVL